MPHRVNSSAIENQRTTEPFAYGQERVYRLSSNVSE